MSDPEEWQCSSHDKPYAVYCPVCIDELKESRESLRERAILVDGMRDAERKIKDEIKSELDVALGDWAELVTKLNEARATLEWIRSAYCDDLDAAKEMADKSLKSTKEQEKS